jgi:hypothetical protein
LREWGYIQGDQLIRLFGGGVNSRWFLTCLLTFVFCVTGQVGRSMIEWMPVTLKEGLLVVGVLCRYALRHDSRNPQNQAFEAPRRNNVGYIGSVATDT